MLQVSRLVPFIIAIVGTLTLAGVLVVVLLRGTIFAVEPQARPLQTTVWAEGTASTARQAEASRDRWRIRTVAYLRGKGFTETQISLEPPLKTTFYKERHEYEADQVIDVRSDTYPPLARTVNALPRDVDPSQKSVSGTFPAPPFLALGVCVAIAYIVFLSIAGAALETRKADVTRAPPGMHPFLVGSQTLLFGLLFVLAVVEAHLLLPEARLLFAFVSTYGVVMLIVWLALTSESWRQSIFLRSAFFVYAAAVVIVIVADIVALRVPMT